MSPTIAWSIVAAPVMPMKAMSRAESALLPITVTLRSSIAVLESAAIAPPIPRPS